MPTQCNADLLPFGTIDRRRMEAAFDGGAITSDAGALLLGRVDQSIRLIERLSAFFNDGPDREFIEHALPTLLMQRVVGIALGYEDLNDHDQLRFDPILTVLAGKSTRNRLEHAPQGKAAVITRSAVMRRPSRRCSSARSGGVCPSRGDRARPGCHR